MQTVGQILQANPSKSGKSLRIKVGEQWFSTDNWALQNAIGKTVRFDVGTSDFQGQTIYFANNAMLDDGSTPQAPSSPAAAPQRPAVAPAAHDNLAFMPFTSNVVAHAIASGEIQKPEDIYAWASKAFHTAKNLVSGHTMDETTGSPAPAAPEFDDDIPF
jgi:hypothetical protein